MERREFLTLFGGAALGTSGWLADRLYALEQEGRLPASPQAPVEGWVSSVCTQCPGGCGQRVRTHRGFPVQLAGNPASPISQGGLCPLGTAGLQLLYHPDRIRGPLLRTGERGEDRWRSISWNEGLGLLHERLQDLRSSNQAHRLGLLADRRGDTLDAVAERFMAAFGSPNYVGHGEPRVDDWAGRLAAGARPAFDLARATFVLSFGFDLLEAEGAPVWQTRCFGERRTPSPLQRGTYVQVEPRLTATGARADRWLSVRPGTEAALALAIAHVLIADGRHDEEFVRRHTFGFEDWTDGSGARHPGFRTVVLRDFAPETAAQVTGIAAEEIVAVARAFGRHEAPLAIAGRGSTGHTNGAQTQRAVDALNALMGRIERPGGLLHKRQAPLRPLAAFESDGIARQGLRQPCLARAGAGPGRSAAAFLEGLAAGEPYALDTLLIAGGNPAFDQPDPERVARCLQRVGFVVRFASLLDETALQADLVLPTPTYLEQWGDATDVPGVGWAHAVVQQPVVEPLCDTRHVGDVLMQAAAALGDATARAFDAADFQALLRWRCEGLFESGRGQLAGGQGGPADGRDPTFEAFWQQLLEGGGWWEPLQYQDPPRFDTPSGRYELCAQGLADPAAPGAAADGEGLPHFEVPRFQGDAGKYPYYLCVFDTNTLAGGNGAALPLMMEMAGFRHDIQWDGWVEVNPEAARQLGLQEGDRLWVESDLGRIEGRARVWPGVPPDVVAVPLGLGHEACGRYARGRGANPLRLIGAQVNPLDGSAPRLATRVRIARVV